MSWRPKKKLDGLAYEQLRRQVKQGRVESLYLFAGEELYLKERALDLLFRSVDESARMLNVAVFSMAGETGLSSTGGRSPASALIDTANQLPMMATRRIVVARDIDKLKDNESELILRYLERPAPTTVLVFQAESVDRRKKLTEALLDKCTVVVFDALSDRDLAKWAEDFASKRGCTIQPKALSRLISLTGSGLMRLANEMEKLATYSAGAPITQEAVEQLVPRGREHSGLELWEAIVRQDGQRALKLLHRLIDDGEEPVVMVGSLAGLFRRMLTAKEMYARGEREYDVAKATGQYGERAAALKARVNRMSRDEIVRRIVRIADVDNAIKRSEATPRLQLEYLVAELVR